MFGASDPSTSLRSSTTLANNSQAIEALLSVLVLAGIPTEQKGTPVWHLRMLRAVAILTAVLLVAIAAGLRSQPSCIV